VLRSHPVLAATAALFTPFSDEDGQPMKRYGFDVRGTCGITFVTPTVAVTAAHCVSDLTADDDLDVRTYDASSISDQALTQASSLVTKEAYPNWHSARRLGAADGYVEKSVEGCKLTARCGPGIKIGNCDHPGDPEDVDVAVLTCSGRAPDAAFVPVVEEDPSLPLEGIFNVWFHEVYDIPEGLPRSDPRAEHYTYYPDDRGDNFHYLGRGPDGVEANQLLPLISHPFSSGAERQAISLHEASGDVWDDLLTCHGTSGSGVFVNVAGRGARFLGPTSQGYESEPDAPRLCQMSSKIVAGKEASSFVAPALVRAILRAQGLGS
jgi:hypothetical protein